MSDYIFLFDLDSTISKKEILPTISELIGRQKEMRELTEATMRGEIPFKSSFIRRVAILSCVDVSEVNRIVSDIPLNNNIVSFIRENKEKRWGERVENENEKIGGDGEKKGMEKCGWTAGEMFSII